MNFLKHLQSTLHRTRHPRTNPCLRGHPLLPLWRVKPLRFPRLQLQHHQWPLRWWNQKFATLATFTFLKVWFLFCTQSGRGVLFMASRQCGLVKYDKLALEKHLRAMEKLVLLDDTLIPKLGPSIIHISGIWIIMASTQRTLHKVWPSRLPLPILQAAG